MFHISVTEPAGDEWVIQVPGVVNVRHIGHFAFAGFCAGLLAGGIAATFYAANCTDDSPLFVATWYPLAIGLLALLGAVLGGRFARW